MDFHLSRLQEPSSWAGIGGFFLSIAQATEGQLSTIAKTLAALSFGAAYFLKERSAGVSAAAAQAIEFFKSKPDATTPVSPQ